MTIDATVVRPDEIGPGDRERWRTWVDEGPVGSPFLSHRFARTIGAVRDDARVAMFREDGRTCGYLAFQVDGDDGGRPIGATIGDAQAVVSPTTWAFDPRRLIEAAGLSRWSFDHLSVAQSAFHPFHVRRHRSPIVELGAGHDAYLTELRGHSKDLLAQVGRRRRKLEREVGPVVCEWQSTRPDDDLQSLREWKTDQYHRDGTWDRFALAWIDQAIEDLARSRDPACTGLLTSVRAGDHLVAVHFGLLGSDRLSWWFPAYDPEFGRYSPGLILILDLIAEAARRSVPRIDLGRGEHGYKLRVTPRSYEVAEGEVSTAGRPAADPDASTPTADPTASAADAAAPATATAGAPGHPDGNR